MPKKVCKVNEKLIAAYVNKIQTSGIPPQQILRSSANTFYFKSHCFLCGLAITPQFIVKQKQARVFKRNLMYSVRQLSVRDTVLRLAESRVDHWGHAIIHRIDQVYNLVAACGQYHSKCMKKLYQRPTVTQKKKVVRLLIILKVLCKICFLLSRKMKSTVNFLWKSC